MNGAPVKHATLFYREEHRHDTYERVKEREMLIEVASWGEHGHESSLVYWYFRKNLDSPLFLLPIGFIIGLISIIFWSNMHTLLIVLMIICIGIATINSNKDFWKWN
jgi:hypothetical protein